MKNTHESENVLRKRLIQQYFKGEFENRHKYAHDMAVRLNITPNRCTLIHNAVLETLGLNKTGHA